MAPVEIVEVIGFANAIWRLGNELFDTVLLDVEIRDPAAMAYFREQIAEVAAVPVLDLREPAGAASVVAASARDTRRSGEGTGRDAGSRRGLRVPWQRRARRPAQPEPLPAAG